MAILTLYVAHLEVPLCGMICGSKGYLVKKAMAPSALYGSSQRSTGEVSDGHRCEQ